jgi:hypothetical protein
VLRGEPGQQRLLLSLCWPARMERLFAKVFNESEFLSPHGLRARSAYHREHPYQLEVEGITASIDCEPAGVIADLIRRRHGDVEAVGDVVRRMGMEMRQ